jgi:hypothetical protein
MLHGRAGQDALSPGAEVGYHPAIMELSSERVPPGGDSRLWLLPVFGLAAWHAWMTLGLFGGDRPWQALLDDRPVVSGRHPLHLYHGSLGARSFLRDGTLSCYDPAFQAGYPKTPVFDAGSRPAELFLLLGGGAYRPAAYKVGLAVCWLLAPLALAVAARGAGLNRRAVLLAVLLGLVVWWGQPCRRGLEAGDLDLLLFALAAVTLFGLLIRFDRRPRPAGWLGLVLAAFVGWFAHPLLSALLVPLVLVYYLSVGARHSSAWSLLLGGGLALAVVGNLFWLGDWVHYWWLRVPAHASAVQLARRTPAGLWHAGVWGSPADRGLALFLFVAAAAGAAILNQSGRRATARLFGLGAVLLITLAAGGVLLEPLARLSTPSLLVPGLLLAAPLAAHALESCWQLAVRQTGHALRAGLLAAAVATGLGLLACRPLVSLATGAQGTLTVGLDGGQERVVELIARHTTTEGRILWEDRRAGPAARWTTLLPLLTGRQFVGGLDADAAIEHTAGGLSGSVLAGRALQEWGDEELGRYCRHYNVGWVVCWSPAAVERFTRWPAAERVCPLDDSGGSLFRLRRPLSFVLKGRARWLGADTSRIALGDVYPDNGELVLSLHYQEGLTVSPSRVRIERYEDPTGRDPIPLVRLKVDAPVARLTLTWRR